MEIEEIACFHSLKSLISFFNTVNKAPFILYYRLEEILSRIPENSENYLSPPKFSNDKVLTNLV